MKNNIKPKRFTTDDPYPLKPYSKLIINAAITGMVNSKADSPYVPVTVDEIDENKRYYAQNLKYLTQVWSILQSTFIGKDI